MLRTIVTAFAALAILCSAPGFVSHADAQGSTAATASKGKRPKTKTRLRPRPPAAYNNAVTARKPYVGRFQQVRLKSGRVISIPKYKVRGSGARGGGVKPRGQLVGRNATAGRGSRGNASKARGKPWSYYNRDPKKVTKTRNNGLKVTFRSSKAKKKQRPKRRASVASERLGRLNRDANNNLPSLTEGGANNAANVLRANRAIDAPRNIVELTPPVPKAQREAGKLTRWGRAKRFFSTKKSS